jgi:hypothetical protein
MAGIKERYSVQFENGRIYSIKGAQSHQGAKKLFIALHRPPAGTKIRVWPQSDPSNKKNMRITGRRRARPVGC